MNIGSSAAGPDGGAKAEDAPSSETAAQQQSASPEKAAGSKTSKPRALLGVVRVGQFAKRVMLDGDVVAELVVICAEKPTTTLLRRMATLLATEILVTMIIIYPL